MVPQRAESTRITQETVCPPPSTGCAPGRCWFTYLHLAASKPCTDALLDRRVTAIAYETVEAAGRSLPLLAPMSEVAGRLAPQVGAYHLMRPAGGRGVLPGGVPGTHPARVVVLGAGVSGMNATAIAVGLGADVTLLDIDVDKLRAADAVYRGRVRTVPPTASRSNGRYATPIW